MATHLGRRVRPAPEGDGRRFTTRSLGKASLDRCCSGSQRHSRAVPAQDRLRCPVSLCERGGGTCNGRTSFLQACPKTLQSLVPPSSGGPWVCASRRPAQARAWRRRRRRWPAIRPGAAPRRWRLGAELDEIAGPVRHRGQVALALAVVARPTVLVGITFALLKKLLEHALADGSGDLDSIAPQGGDLALSPGAHQISSRSFLGCGESDSRLVAFP